MEGALTEHQQQQQASFPNLTNLQIKNCPVLTSMPLFPNLESLSLINTSSKPLEQMIKMRLNSDSVTALSSTSSSYSSSPLSKFKDLTIQNVGDLESLPEEIDNLSSLIELTIDIYSNLISHSKGIGILSSLNNLYIGGMQQFDLTSRRDRQPLIIYISYN